MVRAGNIVAYCMIITVGSGLTVRSIVRVTVAMIIIVIIAIIIVSSTI